MRQIIKKQNAEIEAPYELPDGWKWKAMPDVVVWGSGGTPKATEPKYYENGTIPWLIIADLNDSIINTSASKITQAGLGNSSAKLVPPNTLLVAMYGSIGKLGITGIECCTNQAIAFAKELKNVTTKYMFYFMASIKNQLISMGRGGTQQNISQSLLKTLIVPLPPTLEEQQRIVARIESLFSKMDQAKEKAQNVVDSFETRKAAILHKAFTGELTARWRKENGVGENNILESILDFSKLLSKKDFSFISEFQNKSEDYVLADGSVWKKCSVGAIGIITNGSTPSRKESSYWNGNIPWVSSGEVSNNIIDSTYECITEEGYNNSSVKKLPVGTILIAMIGEGKTRGQSSILNIEATTNQNIAAIKIEHGFINSKFLWYWLQKEYKKNREAGSGSGPQALNCQRVRELDFIVPTLEEQNKIVQTLECVIEKESKAKEAAEAVLEQIDLLKKSILARAFRGEL